jgi:hypothetical protein
MRWINGYIWEEKVRRKGIWHEWFAWYPVIVGQTEEKRKIIIWWEKVLRKRSEERRVGKECTG